MTNEEFHAWLLGYVLLAKDRPINSHQIAIIKNHANLVLVVDGYLIPEHQTLIQHLQVGQRLGTFMKS